MAKTYVGTATMDTEGLNVEAPTTSMPVPVNYIRRMWAAFHNAIILALIFTLLGVGIGVKVAHQFYVDKLDEVVQTGAMLHKKKVYTIQAKI